MKSPIFWYGGKYHMRKAIISLFPEHKLYIEGFGGAGHVLFGKAPSEIEVYNDIDSELYNFFKVLRDKGKNKELLEKLRFTLYSREEFKKCKNSNDIKIDEVEKARIFYVKVMQSFNGIKGSWRYSRNDSKNGMSSCVSSWLGHINNDISNVVDRFKTVQVENLDILELIKKYDTEESLFYLDPPYILQTRAANSKNVYKYEMSDKQHENLVEFLLNIKGKVILSGYENSIYKTLEQNKWNKIFLGEYKKSSSKNKGKEFIWLNYKINV